MAVEVGTACSRARTVLGRAFVDIIEVTREKDDHRQ
jgi:hypothetical protein